MFQVVHSYLERNLSKTSLLKTHISGFCFLANIGENGHRGKKNNIQGEGSIPKIP